MDLSKFRYQGEDARELKPAKKTLGSPPRRSKEKKGEKEKKADAKSHDESRDGEKSPVIGSTRDLRPLASSLASLPILLQPGLSLVFVGFNPGIMSSEKGHYYAHHSNAFWKNVNKYIVKNGSLTCYDDSSLMESHGIGFTDLVSRPTRGCEDLSREEMSRGAETLVEQIQTHKPAIICIVGRGIWEMVFRSVFKHQGVKKSNLPQFGLMPVRLGRGTRVFVVPSTSGLVRDKREDLWEELGGMYDEEKEEKEGEEVEEEKEEKEVEEERDENQSEKKPTLNDDENVKKESG